jgi:hypothetical protein
MGTGMTRLLLLLGCIAWSLPSQAGNLRHLGEFEGLRVSESNHCYGFRLSLWASGNANIVGLLSRYAGSCADPGCSVVTGNIEQSRIHFATQRKIYATLYQFNGEREHEDIVGAMNSEPLKLEKQKSDYDHTSENEWCAKKIKVSRCAGVEAYCGSRP